MHRRFARLPAQDSRKVPYDGFACMWPRCPPVSLPGVTVGTPTAQRIQCCEYYLLALRKQRTVMRPFELAAMRVSLPELLSLPELRGD